MAGFMCALLAAGSLAQDGEEAIFAEVQPLAPRSLLLDITRLPSGGLVAVGERGHVVLSADGADWRQAASVPTRSTLTSVAVAGDRVWAAGHDTVILRSDDGGINWTLQNFEPERQQPILDLFFVDQDLGYAIGAYGLMLVTDDGGESWDDLYPSEDEWHLNALLQLEDGRLLIAGEKGISYLSEDGGENWEMIEMPYPGSMFSLSDDQACLLVAGLRGHAQESCEDIMVWEEIETGTDATLSGSAWDGENLVLVGNSGAVLTRRPDGSFSGTFHSSGVDFAAAIADGPGRFILVGEDGVHRYPEAAAGGDE